MKLQHSITILVVLLALFLMSGTVIGHVQIAVAQDATGTPDVPPIPVPTEEPAPPQTEEPAPPPTEEPTQPPAEEPTQAPTEEVTHAPTEEPSTPTAEATAEPTETSTATSVPPTATNTALRVAFSASPASGNAPLSVSFSDASTGAAFTRWQWDFGDGTTATGQGPHSHTYTTPGTYTATLTAFSPAGSGTASQQIVVFEPRTTVEARFSSQQTGNLDICFTNTSSGNITSNNWNFGDGGTSTDTNPCHPYPATGQYTVTLSVTGSGGETSTASGTVVVRAATQAPDAAFTADRVNLPPGGTVRFTDQSTGLIRTWAWDFGDGATSSDRQPSHQYSNVGTYTVTLTVTGPGGSDQATAIITVAPENVLTCSFDAPGQAFAGQQLTFRNTSRVVPGSFSGFVWSINGAEAATTTDLTTTFTDAGTYTVRLVGTTVDGRTCEAERRVTIQPAESVIANFTGIRNVTTGTEICLRDRSQGAIVSWAWAWGDGATSTDQNPCYTYSAAGSYWVELTVTGQSGATASRSRALNVYDPPIITATSSPLSGVAPLMVNFSATGTNVNRYEWVFPDGSRSFASSAQFQFDQPGSYIVTVTGTGPVGSVSADVIVQVRQPLSLRAAFGASPWNGVAPVEVCFTDHSEGESVTGWTWNFGDGSTSNEQNPCHTYTTAGDYGVQLQVSNSDGMTASASNTVRVYNPINGGASFRVRSVDELTVCFTSSIDPGFTLVRWEFGDGSTSTEAEPCHTYPAEGIYTVTLIIQDSNGVERVLTASIELKQGEAEEVTATPEPTETPDISVFDPALSKLGYLPAGSIGLPGEELHWLTTVTNNGGAAGRNVVVVDNVRPELRIDEVQVAPGSSYTINGQQVRVTIPTLLPGERQDFTIITTVLTSPLSGTIDNTVRIDATGDAATATIRLPGMSIMSAPPVNGPIPLINGVPEISDFGGRPFCFTPNFTNAGTNEGYGPYITIVRDANLTLNSINYLGIDLTAAPYLVASGLLPANDPLEGRAIPGTAGQQWITVRLPIGSVETTSPAIPIQICMTSLPTAAFGVPLPINIYPGYEFGDTPTGANGPISNLNDRGSMDNTGSFTPILVTFDKSNTLPESEVVPSCYPAPPVGAPGQPGAACAAPPGVQWPYEYVLAIELAPGQTLTGNSFTDVLDLAFEFYPYVFPVATLANAVNISGTCNTSGGVTATFNGNPVTALPALQPPGGGTLRVNIANIVNPSATNTCILRLRYRGFINDTLSETAAPETYTAVNTANYVYNHVSGPQPVLTDTDNVDVRNLEIQKSASPSVVAPGDVVTYTLSFQLSEYIGVQNLTLSDIIPDGIDFNPGSGRVTVPGVGTNVPITGANQSITYGADTGTLFFNVTGALPGPYASQGTVSITYTGTVRQIYRAGGTLTGYVSANDDMTNSITANFVTTGGQTFSDESSASVRVIPNSLTKQLVSTPVDSAAGFVPGEPVTFRLVLRVPSGNTRNLVIDDNFPLPVFDVDDGDFGIEAGTINLPDPTGRSAPFDVPNVNGYCSSYDDPNLTFSSYTRACGLRFIYDSAGTNGTNLPAGSTITVTRFGNTVRLAVDAPVETNVTEERRIVVELTAGIIDRPFNDGLFLSNRSQATYTNTLGGTVTLNADDFVDVAAPDVQICKGISGTTNASSMAVAGATCRIPGAPNNNLTNVDATDVLTYTITARNQGSARAYGVVIADNVTTLPQVTGCALVSVRNGSGAALAFTGTFPSITLTNPLPGAGSTGVSVAQATAVVTYTCTVSSTIVPISAPVVNQASVVFAAFSDTLPGGPHVNPPTVPFPPRTDVASFTTTAPNITKTRTPATATIGDLITYTLTVDIPGGTMSNVNIVDTLDAGLAFVDCTSVSVTAGNINSSVGPINTATFCNDPVNPLVPAGPAGGGTATWNFGNLTDPGSNLTDLDTITITYTAVVLNVAANVRGQDRNNSAVLGWDNPAGGRFTDSASAPDTRLIEPTLVVDKTVDLPTNRDANDLVTFTIVVRHAAGSNATAHNVSLSDVIPAGLIYEAGTLTNSAGVAPATLTEAAGTITATWTSLTTAQTSTLRFQSRLAANVQPAQVITNTANIAWTSLPGSPTNTAYNSLGVERTGDIADVGGAPNNYRASDPATVTVGNPSAVKTVVATSLADTGNGSDTDPDLTIGEQVTYQITITFREGVTRNAVIRDTLPSGTAVLGYVSSRIVSIGSNLSFSTATPAVGQAGTVTGSNVDWSLSDITNVADNTVTAADTIVVEVVARVTDVVANSGLAPTQDLNVVNTGQIRYTNFLDVPVAQSGTTTVDIVEPRLTVDKTANVTDADAGDTVIYTVVVRNTGTAPAYNVVITDPLLPQLQLQNGTVTTTAGTITTGNTAGDTTIQVDVPSLAVGGSVTIRYRATLLPTVFPGQLLVNTATQTSNSLPDGTGRTGTSSDPATVRVILPEFTKDIVDTSEAATFPGAGTTNQYTAAPDLAIGETITYQMTIVVPEGTSNTLRLVDTLPSVAGGDPGTLAYVSSRVVSIGANISNSALAVGAPGTVAGQVITFNFVGATPISNVADGVSDANDRIVVEVVARVSNIPANVTGDLLTNRARLTYDGGNTLDASAAADVVEPNLNIDKTASPSTNLNAGDVITYTLVITHTAASRADAFDLRISDTIPAGLTYVAGSLTNAAGAAGTLDATGAPTLVITWDTIPLGSSSTITYQVTVNNGITHAQSLTNTANLGYSSLDDGTPTSNDPNERTYTDSDPATVTTNLAPLSFTKTVVATSETYTGAGQHGAALPDLTIGETVTYELRARLQEGTTPVTITDTLPAGLTFISTQLAPTNGANITITGGFPAPTLAGQVMTLALGNVVNAADNVANAADDLVIWVVARASDVPANVGTTGADKINTATLNWGGGTLSDTETVEIVEPNLNIDKTASPTTGLNAGDTVTYTLVISHTGTSTADAFDLRITDTLPTGILYGSVTAAASTCDERAGWSVDTAGLPGTVIYRMDDLPLTATCTITYTATIANTVVNGTSLTNTAALRYSSLDDGTPDTNDANERVYNDSDPATVTTDVAPLSFTKTVVATSETYTGAGQHGPTLPDLTIGETVTYELRARLQEGTTPVTITDALPTGLTFVSTQLAPTNGANVTITGGFPAPTLAGQVMTLALGNVVNAGDNVANTDDDLVIWVVARASNLVANNGTTGVDKINTATLNWGGGTLSDTETVEIVEPNLNIDKTANPVSGLNGGDEITYTLVITHTGTSTADAFDLRITDVVPAGLTYVAGSLTNTAGAAATFDASGTPTLVITWDTIPLAGSSTITYRATVDNSTVTSRSYTNTATLGYSSLDDGTPDTNDPNERVYTDSDNATVTADVEPLSFSKAVVATSQTYTGAGQHGAALPDLTIGETVTYELRARLQEGTTPVTITDTLPAGLTFISTQLAPTNGANVTITDGFPAPTLAGQVMTLTLGNVVNAGDNLVNADDDLVIWVVARASNVVANNGTTGADKINTATLNWGGGTLSDTETVEIVEPLLDITKSATPNLGLDAGDIVTYTFSVTHTAASTADAQDVSINDLLPNHMTYVGNVAAVTGPAPTVTNSSPNIIFSWANLPLGSAYTFTFEVRVDPTVGPADSLTNTATLDWSTLPGGDPTERTYTDTATAVVTTRPPTMEKTIFATSLTETGSAQHDPAIVDVNIGETVTYHMTITMPEGSAQLTLTDNLPDVMTVVSSRVFSLGGNITAGLAVGTAGTISDTNFIDGLPDQVIFNLGTVQNTADNVENADDQIVLEVVARVDENALNRNGDQLTNSATLDYGTGTVTDTEVVEVVEPELNIDKSALVVTGRPGDIIEYTLVVGHDAASNTAAYDLVITDPMLPDLNLVVGSVTTSAGTVITGNTAGDTTLRVEVGTLNPGDTITITYRAQISLSITPPVTFVNTATLNYDSVSGPGGRPGTDSDTHTVRVNDDVYRYSKTVVDTSLDDTGNGELTSAPDVTIGERVTFHIEAYLPEGTTTNFTITDNLPDGLIVVSSRVVSIGGNLTPTTLAVGDPGVHSNSNYTADAFDDRVVFAFGNVTNLIDGVDDALDVVLVEVEARVYDNALLNRGGETVTNEALIDYGPNQRRTEADVDIVEPNINLTKTFTPRIEGRGHVLGMTLELVNSGTSIGYKVALRDPLNPGLCLNTVTVDVSGAPGTTFTDSSTTGCGGIVQINFNQLAIGARVLVTVELTIDPALTPIPQDIPNTADVTYQSIPEGHPDEREARRYRDEGTDVLTVDEPTVEMTKIGNPQLVQAGGLLTYTITVTNAGVPPIDAWNLVITDTLPSVLTFVSATPSKGTCSASGQVVTCLVDKLLRGETMTITLQTRVSSSAAAGTRILNSVGLITLEGAIAEADAVNVVGEVTVCSLGCPDVQLYHSDQTGDWEIFRLVGGVVSPADVDINLTQNPADDVEPSQSPDGQWMAFASNRDGNWEIYVTPTDGDLRSARRVTYNTRAVDTDPAWGPTDYLVYESTRDGNWELYLLDLRTGVETRLTNNPADDLNAFWSPDGTRLVFQSNRSGRWQLYELNLLTANLRLLSDGSSDDMDASYSNSGDRIVFRSVNAGGTVISIMNADGSGRTVISDRSSRAANPVWSPDDSLIAYQSDLDGDLDIYIYGVGAGQTRKLTENTVDDYAPTWLCGSLRVVFTSDAPDNPDIFQADALPLAAPAINVLEYADQLTIDPNQDIYPQGAPGEENASLEGTLPDTASAEPGHTQVLNLGMAVTPQDRTLDRDEAWAAITGCAEIDLTLSPPLYALNLLPIP